MVKVVGAVVGAVMGAMAEAVVVEVEVAERTAGVGEEVWLSELEALLFGLVRAEPVVEWADLGHRHLGKVESEVCHRAVVPVAVAEEALVAAAAAAVVVVVVAVAVAVAVPVAAAAVVVVVVVVGGVVGLGGAAAASAGGQVGRGAPSVAGVGHRTLTTKQAGQHEGAVEERRELDSHLWVVSRIASRMGAGAGAGVRVRVRVRVRSIAVGVCTSNWRSCTAMSSKPPSCLRQGTSGDALCEATHDATHRGSAPCDAPCNAMHHTM